MCKHNNSAGLVIFTICTVAQVYLFHLKYDDNDAKIPIYIIAVPIKIILLFNSLKQIRDLTYSEDLVFRKINYLDFKSRRTIF